MLFKNQSMLLSATRRTSQILNYPLFKTQSMLLLATKKKGQPDPAYTLFKTQSMLLSTTDRKGRCWLTIYPKPRACSCQLQGERASQMLTYNLFKTKSMPLSAANWEGQPNADLHPVYNQSTFLLTSSWDQLAIGLHPVQIHHFILELDTQVSSTDHMWKTMQYFLNHLHALSLSPN